MPRTRLALSRETLDELTSDEMSAVVGGADSNSCSCTIANVCINFADDAVLTVVRVRGC